MKCVAGIPQAMEVNGVLQVVTKYILRQPNKLWDAQLRLILPVGVRCHDGHGRGTGRRARGPGLLPRAQGTHTLGAKCAEWVVCVCVWCGGVEPHRTGELC